MASEMTEEGLNEEAGASSSRESEARHDTPVVESPPTSPPHSPWWTAPAGKPVDIPAFGRTLIDALVAILAPAPQPVPIRVRVRR
jgi:hypothetical protein